MMEFETLNTDKLLMMMKVWICAKKNCCCRVPPAWKEEGLLVHITDFFLLTILDHHAPRISYLELATTTILLRSITQKKQIS